MSPLPPPALTPPADLAAIPAWLDWLDTNRLTPLVAHTLADTQLPEEVRAHLNIAYILARAQWLQRQYETASLLDILAQTPSIPSVLLKGIALAVSLYADPALRPMNDVDFLVPVDSLSKLSERLKRCGYIEEGHTPGLDVTKLYQMCFISSRTASSLKLEFHATFTHLKSTHETEAMHWFWSQAEIFDFYGHSVRGLNPTSQLLYLSAHSMQQHGKASTPLIWIHDIDLLIRNRGADINWSEIFDIAHEFGWEASLYSACEFAQSSFATPLPPPLHEWLQQDPTDLIGFETVTFLASDDVTRSQNMMQSLQHMSAWRRIGYVFHLVLPHPHYMRHRYPSFHPLLLPFTYLYRWFDIARDLFVTGFRSIRRRFHG